MNPYEISQSPERKSYHNSDENTASNVSIKIFNGNDDDIVIRLCRNRNNRQRSGSSCANSTQRPTGSEITDDQDPKMLRNFYRNTFGPTLDETVLVGMETIGFGQNQRSRVQNYSPECCAIPNELSWDTSTLLPTNPNMWQNDSACTSRTNTSQEKGQNLSTVITNEYQYNPGCNSTKTAKSTSAYPIKEQAPINRTPRNQASCNQAPRNQAPISLAPRNQAPINYGPRNQAPRNQAPINQAPRNQVPRNQAPRNQAPRNQAPCNLVGQSTTVSSTSNLSKQVSSDGINASYQTDISISSTTDNLNDNKILASISTCTCTPDPSFVVSYFGTDEDSLPELLSDTDSGTVYAEINLGSVSMKTVANSAESKIEDGSEFRNTIQPVSTFCSFLQYSNQSKQEEIISSTSLLPKNQNRLKDNQNIFDRLFRDETCREKNRASSAKVYQTTQSSIKLKKTLSYSEQAKYENDSSLTSLELNGWDKNLIPLRIRIPERSEKRDIKIAEFYEIPLWEQRKVYPTARFLASVLKKPAWIARRLTAGSDKRPKRKLAASFSTSSYMTNCSIKNRLKSMPSYRVREICRELQKPGNRPILKVKHVLSTSSSSKISTAVSSCSSGLTLPPRRLRSGTDSSESFRKISYLHQELVLLEDDVKEATDTQPRTSGSVNILPENSSEDDKETYQKSFLCPTSTVSNEKTINPAPGNSRAKCGLIVKIPFDDPEQITILQCRPPSPDSPEEQLFCRFYEEPCPFLNKRKSGQQIQCTSSFCQRETSSTEAQLAEIAPKLLFPKQNRDGPTWGQFDEAPVNLKHLKRISNLVYIESTDNATDSVSLKEKHNRQSGHAKETNRTFLKNSGKTFPVKSISVAPTGNSFAISDTDDDLPSTSFSKPKPHQCFVPNNDQSIYVARDDSPRKCSPQRANPNLFDGSQNMSNCRRSCDEYNNTRPCQLASQRAARQGQSFCETGNRNSLAPNQNVLNNRQICEESRGTQRFITIEPYRCIRDNQNVLSPCQNMYNRRICEERLRATQRILDEPKFSARPNFFLQDIPARQKDSKKSIEGKSKKPCAKPNFRQSSNKQKQKDIPKSTDDKKPKKSFTKKGTQRSPTLGPSKTSIKSSRQRVNQESDEKSFRESDDDGRSANQDSLSSSQQGLTSHPKSTDDKMRKKSFTKKITQRSVTIGPSITSIKSSCQRVNQDSDEKSCRESDDDGRNANQDSLSSCQQRLTPHPSVTDYAVLASKEEYPSKPASKHCMCAKKKAVDVLTKFEITENLVSDKEPSPDSTCKELVDIFKNQTCDCFPRPQRICAKANSKNSLVGVPIEDDSSQTGPLNVVCYRRDKLTPNYKRVLCNNNKDCPGLDSLEENWNQRNPQYGRTKGTNFKDVANNCPERNNEYCQSTAVIFTEDSATSKICPNECEIKTCKRTGCSRRKPLLEKLVDVISDYSKNSSLMQNAPRFCDCAESRGRVVPKRTPILQKMIDGLSEKFSCDDKTRPPCPLNRKSSRMADKRNSFEDADRKYPCPYQTARKPKLRCKTFKAKPKQDSRKLLRKKSTSKWPSRKVDFGTAKNTEINKYQPCLDCESAINIVDKIKKLCQHPSCDLNPQEPETKETLVVRSKKKSLCKKKKAPKTKIVSYVETIPLEKKTSPFTTCYFQSIGSAVRGIFDKPWKQFPAPRVVRFQANKRQRSLMKRSFFETEMDVQISQVFGPNYSTKLDTNQCKDLSRKSSIGKISGGGQSYEKEPWLEIKLKKSAFITDELTKGEDEESRCKEMRSSAGSETREPPYPLSQRRSEESAEKPRTASRTFFCEKGKSFTAQETRYAITRVTKYEDYTTYEVLKSTRAKPRKIPDVLEKIFIEKEQ